MNRRLLARALAQHLSLPIIGNLTPPTVLGALYDGPTGLAAFNALANAASPMTIPLRYSAVTNATTAALTMTAANAIQGIVGAFVVSSGGSANTNTTDTASNILTLFWPNAVIGSVAVTWFANLNSGTMTLAGGTGVTITGTATTPTLAFTVWQASVQNLAAPAGTLGNQTLKPGQASTNTTTTTSATTNNAGTNNPTSIINVAASTGMTANSSWLGVVNTDGTTSYYLITAINTLAITVQGNINKNIANGAAVSVFNDKITFTRMFSCVTATLAA
jgi:hypothetical protein